MAVRLICANPTCKRMLKVPDGEGDRHIVCPFCGCITHLRRKAIARESPESGNQARRSESDQKREAGGLHGLTDGRIPDPAKRVDPKDSTDVKRGQAKFPVAGPGLSATRRGAAEHPERDADNSELEPLLVEPIESSSDPVELVEELPKQKRRNTRQSSTRDQELDDERGDRPGRRKRKLRRRRRRPDEESSTSIFTMVEPGLLGLAAVAILFLAELIVALVMPSVGVSLLIISGIILLVSTTLWLLWEAVQELGWESMTNWSSGLGALLGGLFLMWVCMMCFGILAYATVLVHVYAITSLGSTWKAYAAWWLSVVILGTGIFLATRPVSPDRKPSGIVWMGDARARAQSAENLKRLGVAIHHYITVHGHFPKDITDNEGRPLLSWRVELLPYLELDNLYQQINRNQAWDSPDNAAVLTRIPHIFRHPGRTSTEAGGTFYQAFAGRGTVFEPGQNIRLSHIRDGTSETILLLESDNDVAWTKPQDIPYDPNQPLPAFWRGTEINVLFVDGSVKRVDPRRVNEPTWRALISRDGGEPVDTSPFR